MDTECVIGTGWKNDAGYVVVTHKGRRVRAHRLAYERVHGPVPKGLELDHLCRNRACVNVDHLEAVTHRENVLRGYGASGINARKTHCKRGHEFTPENTIRDRRGRQCLTCTRHWDSPRLPRRLRTTCSNGHPYAEFAILMGREQQRRCGECRRLNKRKHRQAIRQSERHAPSWEGPMIERRTR